VADAGRGVGQARLGPALWAGVGGVVIGAVTVATREATDRVPATLLLAAGVAVGLAAGLLLASSAARRSGRPAGRTVMERLNDGAFAVVLLAVWGLSLAVLGPWSGLLAGLGAGLLVAMLARRA
jgi:hypothetical protein